MNVEKCREEVKKACEVLKNGGVILYPTDTIWGIGCDATNDEAVKRVYELKKREDSKAMLVLLDDLGKLASYVDVPDITYDLLEAADRPMTVIYPRAKNLAKGLVSADGTIGIRITKEIFSRMLVARFRKPIVSTSANISGDPSPKCFADISDEVKKSVDYVVDFRQEETTNPAPSSIVKLGLGGEIQIIRQ
ncbi:MULTISPECIES: L-threonylcarbamoyladenylate synthase [Sanguibacteroides]|uniref:L-threonylcarbamoyladenylate synthase n=1 Tax=Sanguibacteroides TaxID=1635148 RepID=UPI000D87AEFF|nr:MULTISPECIES: L-threonylcarbamoyladenylate synthase [Sanguibacteroides]PXZ44480.1 threonylcarbamoyl-AMP synthase [Sanguibacteroides justesenii]